MLPDTCEDRIGHPIKCAALQTHEELYHWTIEKIKTFHLSHWLLSDASIRDTGHPINCTALRTQSIRGTGHPKELKKIFQIHHLLLDASSRDTRRLKELKKISQTHRLLSDASNVSTGRLTLPTAIWLFSCLLSVRSINGGTFWSHINSTWSTTLKELLHNKNTKDEE